MCFNELLCSDLSLKTLQLYPLSVSRYFFFLFEYVSSEDLGFLSTPAVVPSASTGM